MQRAWRSLINAIEDQPNLSIVERDDKGLYLRAQAISTVPKDGIDDVEFRLVDDPRSGVRALFRSATRQAVFLYPLQQPVPNQKSHTDRLEDIRLRLGWESLGLAGDGALEADMGAQKLGVHAGGRNSWMLHAHAPMP